MMTNHTSPCQTHSVSKKQPLKMHAPLTLTASKHTGALLQLILTYIQLLNILRLGSLACLDQQVPVSRSAMASFPPPLRFCIQSTPRIIFLMFLFFRAAKASCTAARNSRLGKIFLYKYYISLYE